jgi:drug/metabolite transporter (DMT)-like permease
VATLLGNTAPIWVALVGFLFFKERFSPRFLVGLAVAFGGVVLLIVGGDKSLAVGDWVGCCWRWPAASATRAICAA